jgi:DNA uptake protein ComE-like DNA-binding protein
MVGLVGLRVGLVRAVVWGGVLVPGIFMGARGSAQTAGSAPAAAPQQTIAEKIAASKGLLDINTATAEQLRALPGMGDAYVQRVIAGRPYSAKNQLTTRGVIPAAEYERIREMIVAHRVKP